MKCSKTPSLCRKDAPCKNIRIELAPKVFSSSIKALQDNKGGGTITIGGQQCHDILSCLMLRFEYEIIHALTFCFCNQYAHSDTGPGNWKNRTAPKSGHSKTFMSILNNIFGHTQYKNDLSKVISKSQSKSIIDT